MGKKKRGGGEIETEEKEQMQSRKNGAFHHNHWAEKNDSEGTRIEEKRIKNTETNTPTQKQHLNTTKKVAGENAFRYVVGLISFSVAETYLETSFQL